MMATTIARLASFQRRFPMVQIVVLVVFFILGAATLAGFSSGTSVRSMLVLASLLGLAASGQSLVLLIGGLDFSVPVLIVLGATIISQLCGSHGWAFIPAFLVVLGICGVTGAAVGWVCHRFRVMPLIVTLAVSSMALGGVELWTKERFTGAAPPFLSQLVAVNGTTFGLSISPVVTIWAVFVIVVAIVLHRTRSGRHLYLTGANPRAAQLSLIRTSRVWTAVYCVSAMMSGIVGVLLAGFGADTTLGDPYLFGSSTLRVGSVRSG